MTDYKLAPKSIVDELAQFIRKVDGNNRMGAGALADKICERFHVAAPAMQGEPVAYLFNDEAGRTKIVLGKETAELWCPPDESITPLYTAPQPAEQQSDVAGLVEALENLLHYLETDDMRDLDMNKARAALATHREQGGGV